MPSARLKRLFGWGGVWSPWHHHCQLDCPCCLTARLQPEQPAHGFLGWTVDSCGSWVKVYGQQQEHFPWTSCAGATRVEARHGSNFHISVRWCPAKIHGDFHVFCSVGYASESLQCLAPFWARRNLLALLWNCRETSAVLRLSSCRPLICQVFWGDRPPLNSSGSLQSLHGEENVNDIFVRKLWQQCHFDKKKLISSRCRRYGSIGHLAPCTAQRKFRGFGIECLWNGQRRAFQVWVELLVVLLRLPLRNCCSFRCTVVSKLRASCSQAKFSAAVQSWKKKKKIPDWRVFFFESDSQKICKKLTWIVAVTKSADLRVYRTCGNTVSESCIGTPCKVLVPKVNSHSEMIGNVKPFLWSIDAVLIRTIGRSKIIWHFSYKNIVNPKIVGLFPAVLDERGDSAAEFAPGSRLRRIGQEHLHHSWSQRLSKCSENTKQKLFSLGHISASWHFRIYIKGEQCMNGCKLTKEKITTRRSHETKKSPTLHPGPMRLNKTWFCPESRRSEGTLMFADCRHCICGTNFYEHQKTWQQKFSWCCGHRNVWNTSVNLSQGCHVRKGFPC